MGLESTKTTVDTYGAALPVSDVDRNLVGRHGHVGDGHWGWLDLRLAHAPNPRHRPAPVGDPRATVVGWRLGWAVGDGPADRANRY